jgi:hypothetical protein
VVVSGDDQIRRDVWWWWRWESSRAGWMMDKTREDPRESPTRELSRNPTRWTFGTAWGLIIIMIIIISSNRRRETRRDVIIQEKSIGSGCFIII